MSNTTKPDSKPEVLNLKCPCGVLLTASGEDALVEQANQHLKDKHPDMANKYTREQILFLAY